jgi:tetratricopeptide (TPR) repeat protein
MKQARELIEQYDAAFEMRKAGNFAGALGRFESLERLSTHPTDIAALRFFQATCLTDMGEPEHALRQLSRVDKSKLVIAKQLDYEYERARIQRALGNTREALKLVERAMKQANGRGSEEGVNVVAAGLHTLQGILLAESGRCEEALPILEAVAADDDGWAEARINLGDCKIRERSYQEAIAYYVSITASSRNVDPIHRKTALRNIGCAYYYMGEYAKAIEFLTMVEHAYDGNLELKAELFGVLGSAYARLGMAQEAAKYSGLSLSTKSVQ